MSVPTPMSRLMSKAALVALEFYHKAEDLLEEEMEIPLTVNLVNAMIDRFVTQKVSKILEMHVELHEGWLRLYATIQFKGIVTTLNTDLLLIQFQLDKTTQRMVFEQKSETRVLSATFSYWYERVGFNVAFWFCHHILHTDPLGFILKKLDIVTIEYDLMFLDLNKYLFDQPKVMRAIEKVQINQAVVREDQLVLKANLNLRAIFGMFNTKPQQNPQSNTYYDVTPTAKPVAELTYEPRIVNE